MTSLLLVYTRMSALWVTPPSRSKGWGYVQQKIHFQRRDRDNLGSLNNRGNTGIYQRILTPTISDQTDDKPCAQLIAQPGIFMSKPQYLQIKDALANQIHSFTGVAEWPWFQQILGFGWTCRPLGLPTSEQGRSLVALQIDVDDRTREQLRASGIFRPIGLADLPAAA